MLDDVSIYETRISEEVIAKGKDYRAHFMAATQELRTAIEKGQVRRSQFTPEQLAAIEKGSDKIPGYTWHHHEDRGRMQLVPKEIHKKTDHTGGMKLWYEEKK